MSEDWRKDWERQIRRYRDQMDPWRNQDTIIERTLEAAQQTHYATELRRLRDRVSRLESQVRLLAGAIRRRDVAVPPPAGRTRPRLVT